MKTPFFFTALLLLFSAVVFSQETIRKIAGAPLRETLGNYTFESAYEPYFINEYYYKDYQGATDKWFYEFKEGKLIVHELNYKYSTLTTLSKYIIDILTIDTFNIPGRQLNSYSLKKRKKEYHITIEYKKGDHFFIPDKNQPMELLSPGFSMDFESYSQYQDFVYEFKREWLKEAAVYTHTKVLKSIDEQHLNNYGSPYLLSLMHDSTLDNFVSVVPFIKNAQLVTKFKGEPMYNLIVIMDRIKNKEGFIRAYYKYDTNINMQDSNGVSPLMLCVGTLKDTALARLLLVMGASPFDKSSESKTAYDYALAVVKQHPAYERIIRNAVINGNYPVQTKIQFCTDYKLTAEGNRLINTIAQKNPDSLQIRYQQAAWYYNTRQYAEAISSFTECLRLNKEEARFYFNRGLSYYALKMMEKAEADFSDAILRKPSYKAIIETAKKQIAAANQ